MMKSDSLPSPADSPSRQQEFEPDVTNTDTVQRRQINDLPHLYPFKKLKKMSITVDAGFGKNIVLGRGFDYLSRHVVCPRLVCSV
jgi:hypothetical protein